MGKISRSALESCTKGDPSEAIPKITQLMNLMMLTGTLVLDNPAPAPSERSPPRDDPPLSPTGIRNTSPPAPPVNSAEPVPTSAPPFLTASDVGNLLDLHSSRKRCASSMSIG